MVGSNVSLNLTSELGSEMATSRCFSGSWILPVMLTTTLSSSTYVNDNSTERKQDVQVRCKGYYCKYNTDVVRNR